MQVLAGYPVEEILYQGKETLLARARRGDKSVLLRQLRAGDARQSAAKLRYGFEVGRSLSVPGLVKPIAIEQRDGATVLVMEDFGGAPLTRAVAEGPLAIAVALRVAVQIAQALGELHKHRIVHKAVSPANVLFDPRTGEARLAHLESASRLGREDATGLTTSRLDQALTYVSPEQTGRMNRLVDYRTDFYSLGVTLYEMLTGEPPFRGSDLLALVHSHLAASPTPPHRARADLPEEVSAVVLKLLAKNAEDRYQSSFGLVADLEECLARLEGRASNDAFVPGRRDARAIFQIPDELYGRDADRAQLLAAFERAAAGGRELVLVSGTSGAGKSALVAEIQRPVVAKRAYFGVGKFDQLRGAPYAALVQALQHLARQVVSEGTEEIAAWRGRLVEALGAGAQVLIDLIPELGLIMGPQPPVVPLGPTEAQSRVNLLFRHLVRALARDGHPLVLFLDDLQWADAASLHVLQILVGDPEIQNLLLIGAYRAGEIDGAHPLAIALRALRDDGAAVSELALGPLGLADVEQLVADTVGAQDAAATRELAELVHRTTGGNPFFVNQMLASLHTRELLGFDPALGRWTWSRARIVSDGIPDGVAGLMTQRIGRLSPEARRVLPIAAAIGGTFELGVLVAVSDASTSAITSALWEAVQEGLVAPIGDAYKYVAMDDAPASRPTEVWYTFLHDRVQEAAYALLDEAARQRAHLCIGRLLLDRHYSESAPRTSSDRAPDGQREARIFDIVDQLDRSVALVTQPAEREELARLNLVAGRRAQASAAYAAAVSYFDVGERLLAEDAWERSFELAFELYRRRGESSYVVGDHDAAEADFQRVLARARSRDEKAALLQLRMVLYLGRGMFPAAAQTGREALALYGLELPATEDLAAAGGAELGKVQAALAGRKIADLESTPEAADPEHRARIALLSQTLLYGAYTQPPLFQYLSLLIVRLSIEHGNAPGSASGYATYGLLLAAAFGDHATAYEFGRLALQVSAKLDDIGTHATIQFYVGAFVNPWGQPVRASIPLLDASYARCLETGYMSYAALAGMQSVLLGLIAGEDLHELIARAQKHRDFQRRAHQNDVANATADAEQAIAMLLAGALPEGSDFLDEATFVAKNGHFPPTLAGHAALGLAVAYLLGDRTRAIAHAEAGGRWLVAIFGHVLEGEFRFYRVLHLASLHADASPEDRDKYAALVAEDRGKLDRYAAACAQNFEARALLAAAEDARISGRDADAFDLYDRAIDAAARAGTPNVEAVACELAAALYLARGRRRTARAYLHDARQAYARWGADTKVAALDRAHPDLSSQSPASAASPDTSAAALDLLTVVKASQAISGEIVLAELLRKLMATVLESAGAQRGMLLLEGEAELVVAADAAGCTLGAPTSDAAGEPVIALSIVRFVARTGEAVVLDDAAGSGRFQSDPYIARAQPKSVLCLPIVKQKKRLGVLYLENNLAPGAFTAERRRVLDLLAAQAAISIENAILYDTLEARVKERTQELRASNDGLSQALRRLRETQQQLVAQEKLASLGALTAGIAHELRNPLNFVKNFSELSIGLAEELKDSLAAESDRLSPDTRADVEDALDTLHENVTRIQEHGARANNIINGMLLHARTTTGTRGPVEINLLVADSIERAAHAAGNPFEVQADLAADAGTIHAVGSDLGRVLVNLLDNALYAVLAKKRSAPAGYTPSIRVRTARRGEEVEIRVRDNGPGIPDDVVDRIYDPFFTTKPTGEGAGLGLSISHDIVVNGHQGRLRVETVPGEHTEFIVTLPIATTPDA